MEPVIGFLEEEEYNEELDGSRLPRSGLEYLRRVQLEAMECPDVVVADVSHKTFINKQTVNINEVSSHMPVPQGLAPSLDWQMWQAADFADVRQRIAHYKATYSKPSGNVIPVLPSKNDGSRWRLFCLGKQGTKNSDVEENTDDTDDTYSKQQKGTPPLFSILIRMNQVMIQKVLEYHVNWLEDGDYSHMQGRWLYSLLACLEKPLLPESTALLRTLARHCAVCRMKQVENDTENKELITSLNLIIVIVSRYFGQTDLADPG